MSEQAAEGRSSHTATTRGTTGKQGLCQRSVRPSCHSCRSVVVQGRLRAGVITEAPSTLILASAGSNFLRYQKKRNQAAPVPLIRRRMILKTKAGRYPHPTLRISNVNSNLSDPIKFAATPRPTDENYIRRQPPQTDPGRRPRQPWPSATFSANQDLRSKKVEDYSAFKGRGRYGVPSSGKKINALYSIDPVLNAGFAHHDQSNEVVRGRDQRRHMDAGDCEY